MEDLADPGSALRFDAVASADALGNGDGDVSLEELRQIALTDLQSDTAYHQPDTSLGVWADFSKTSCISAPLPNLPASRKPVNATCAWAIAAATERAIVRGARSGVEALAVLNRIRAKLHGILNATSAPPAGRPSTSVPKPAPKREPAPVIVYFERDRNQRLIERVRELLESKQSSRSARWTSAATRPPWRSSCAKPSVKTTTCPSCSSPAHPSAVFNELVDWDVLG